MIRNAYIAPTESPVGLTEVKRALLTYDRVYLPDPGDRDLIPPQSFSAAAFGMPVPMSWNGGPVRELGKVQGYDNSFDQLVDGLKDAIRAGCVEVVSIYDLETSNQAVIGTMQMGGFPLNPSFMLYSYRSIAREQAILQAALVGDANLMGLELDELAGISLKHARGDGGINDGPDLPLLDGDLDREFTREDLTMVARARIASTMKSVGFCATKEIVPVFEHPNYRAVLGGISDRATAVIDRIGEEDPYWQSRSRALALAHDEYLDEAVLAEMPVSHVLSLRDAAWGRQAEGRDNLFRSISELARQSSEVSGYDAHIIKKIQAYRAAADEVTKSRSKLNFNINCELMKAVGGVASSLTAGGVALGAVSLAQTALGAGTLLAAGSMWAVDKIKDIKPIADELRYNEEDLKGDVCFGLHDFYRRIGNIASSDNIS